MMHLAVRFKADTRALRNILTEARRREKKMLNHIGGTIRKTGQRSMKQGRKRQTSQPGSPPLAWTKRYKHNVKYAYDGARHSVVIGAVSFDGLPVPGFIEHGGMQVIVSRKTGKRSVARYQARPAMRLALEKVMHQALPKILKDYIHK